MNRHRILVVDDDSMVLKTLENTFESIGYEVFTAQNGQEALESCIKTLPSLIISDWQMPVLSGIDLFFHLKNTPSLQSIPFVLITVSDDEDTKVALLENGLEDYWDKPLNIKEVIIKTKRILSRLQLPQENILQLAQNQEFDADSETTKVPISFSKLKHTTDSNNTTSFSCEEPSETYLYVNRTLNNRYKLSRPIGRGGMGIIYHAYDLVKNQDLALKLLRREYTSSNTEVSRFCREATTTLQIKHPNVIEIYEYGTTSSGQMFITMEILTGHSLMTELVKNPNISYDYAIKIMEQVCSGVLAVHQQEIIHRDLKPSNIFLLHPPSKESILKVLDFGIAFLPENKHSSSERLTDPNVIVGTPEYMSPEQIRKQELGKESDTYSLGIIFYEILTGELPFLGSPIEILFSHVNKDPVPIDQLISINTELSNLIMSMLAKDPKMRPTLESVIAALNKFSNQKDFAYNKIL